MGWLVRIQCWFSQFGKVSLAFVRTSNYCLSSSGLAALALVNTNAAAATGLVTWVVIDAIRGHVSISGACVGPIVGLVAVTPACGFIQPGWALLFGFTATCIVYPLLLMKRYMHFDDTLDVALVHGGGMLENEP